MVLPPDGALVTDDGGVRRTYAEHREAAATALRLGSGSPTGLSLCGDPLDAGDGDGDGVARRALADEGSCDAPFKYCWMSCQDTSHLPCGTDAVCVYPDGTAWLQGQVCHSCQLTCPTESEPPPPPQGGALGPVDAGSSDAFCNSALPAVSMWMDGFRGGGDPMQPCLLFLFQGWVVTSEAEMAGYAVLTLAMGFLVEVIVAGRRTLSKRPAAAKKSLAHQAADTASYGMQLLLGYWLMLVAMTYQVELFVAVVLGIMAGYLVFNRPALGVPVAHSAEACCRGQELPRMCAPERAEDESLRLNASGTDRLLGGPSVRDCEANGGACERNKVECHSMGRDESV